MSWASVHLVGELIATVPEVTHATSSIPKGTSVDSLRPFERPATRGAAGSWVGLPGGAGQCLDANLDVVGDFERAIIALHGLMPKLD